MQATQHRIAQSSVPGPSVCLRCRHNQEVRASRRHVSLDAHYATAAKTIHKPRSRPALNHLPRARRRYLHRNSSHQLEQVQHQAWEPAPSVFKENPQTSSSESPNSIRARLRQWQSEHTNDDPIQDIEFPVDRPSSISSQPNASRLGEKASDHTHEDIAGSEDGLEVGGDWADAAGADVSNEVLNHGLQPGDLVQFTLDRGSNARGHLAVFVRQVDHLIQLYTERGRWVHVLYLNAQFGVSDWAPKEMLDAIKPHLPTVEQMADPKFNKTALVDTGVPREVGTPLVKLMQNFAAESAELYRQHASELDNAHSRLAHSIDLRYTSLTSATMHLLKMKKSEITPVALYVVRMALVRAGEGFLFDRKSHRQSGFLQVRSKASVNTIDAVVQYFREWQDSLSSQAAGVQLASSPGPIPRFLQKARRIAAHSRQTRQVSASGSLGPSKSKRKLMPEHDAVYTLKGEEFAPEERHLMNFLEQYACSDQFREHGKLEAIAALLLNATGLYKGFALDRSIAYTFLQELGMLTPHENRHQYNPHLMLPMSKHSIPLYELHNKIQTEEPNFTDTMRDLRHDWHALPTYCIDGKDAHEIDDGISVENIPDSKDRWVRMHIANPTAFLARDMPMARMARHMGETIYACDRTHMMLPSHTTQSYWSLAPDRPCLTFSARIDEHGNIVDKDIRCGTVHNVKRMTPRRVNQILDPSYVNSTQVVLVVGEDIPASGQSTTTDDDATPSSDTLQDRDNLSSLADISKRLRARRVKNGGILFDMPRAEVDVWSTWQSKGLSWRKMNRMNSTTTLGDPVIRWSGYKYENFFRTTIGNPASELVQECMLLASEVAALWCSERAIPIICRGTLSKEEKYDYKRFWQEKCEPAISDNSGELPLPLGIEYVKRMGTTALSTTPVFHRVLGLENYTKVTSPLRRYGDMVAHWQIEAALREEARTGISLTHPDSNPSRSFLPFSDTVVRNFLLSYQAREKLIQMVKRNSLRYWECMLMLRATEYKELELPLQETFRVVITRMETVGVFRITGVIEELGIPIYIPPEHLDGMTFQVGDIWEASMDMVNTYRAETWVKPLRLLQRWNV